MVYPKPVQVRRLNEGSQPKGREYQPKGGEYERGDPVTLNETEKDSVNANLLSFLTNGMDTKDRMIGRKFLTGRKERDRRIMLRTLSPTISIE